MKSEINNLGKRMKNNQDNIERKTYEKFAKGER